MKLGFWASMLGTMQRIFWIAILQKVDKLAVLMVFAFALCVG